MTMPPLDLTDFLRSLNGVRGEFDAWLEVNNEAEVREHIKAYAAAVRAATIEECAGICDRFADRKMHPAECAAAIRALDVDAGD